MCSVCSFGVSQHSSTVQFLAQFHSKTSPDWQWRAATGSTKCTFPPFPSPPLLPFFPSSSSLSFILFSLLSSPAFLPHISPHFFKGVGQRGVRKVQQLTFSLAGLCEEALTATRVTRVGAARPVLGAAGREGEVRTREEDERRDAEEAMAEGEGGTRRRKH